MVFITCLSYYSEMAHFKIKTVFESQPLWQQFIIVLIFNTLIATLIHSIISNSSFVFQMIMSQSIGLSIFLSFIVYANFFKLKTWRILVPLIFGAPIGVSLGITFQALLMGASFEVVIQAAKENYTNILSILFSALFFGIIVVAFFANRENIFRARTKLQTEKIHNLNHQKNIAETSLRLLQAQIEPHFLFNTLSNVISLIEKDPQKSKLLLESLTEFLRASLKRSTDIQQNLRNEISLISNYLDILKIRIGKRLEYNIYYKDDIIDCAFPPLLLQPLIENAIIHGIEPLAEGGVIDISIAKDNHKLIITVSDTGKGLATENIKGFGLTNIRERIKSIYGDDGHLTIEENQPCGVTASIEVPYEPV